MIARSAGFLQIFLGISGAITTPFAGNRGNRTQPRCFIAFFSVSAVAVAAAVSAIYLSLKSQTIFVFC